MVPFLAMLKGGSAAAKGVTSAGAAKGAGSFDRFSEALGSQAARTGKAPTNMGQAYVNMPAPEAPNPLAMLQGTMSLGQQNGQGGPRPLQIQQMLAMLRGGM